MKQSNKIKLLGGLCLVILLTFFSCKSSKHFSDKVESNNKIENVTNQDITTDKNTVTDITVYEFEKDTCNCNCDSVKTPTNKPTDKPKIKKIIKYTQTNKDKIVEQDRGVYKEDNKVKEEKTEDKEVKSEFGNYVWVFCVGLFIGILIPIVIRLLLLYFFHR